MKIPFDIKYRPQIESGEYKVILDCGVEAEILAWNKPGDYPIVCMAKKDGAIPFRVDNNGKAYHFPEGANYSDLFIVTPEEEMTEFEKAIGDIIKEAVEKEVGDNAAIWAIARGHSQKLFALARKELRDEIEFCGEEYRKGYEDGKVEALKEIREDIKKAKIASGTDPDDELEYRELVLFEAGKKEGQKEALKDLPRWERLYSEENADKIPDCIIPGKALDNRLVHRGFELKITDLEKLPGFNE